MGHLLSPHQALVPRLWFPGNYCGESDCLVKKVFTERYFVDLL